MTVVVDASMAAAWVLPDEQNALSDTLLDQVETDGALVPSIFRHEVRNIFLEVERRGRSQKEATEAALRKLRELTLDVVENGSDDVIPTLARRHHLSAYDAAYLDIAVRRGLSLATADRRLAAAAHAIGITVLGPYAVLAP